MKALMLGACLAAVAGAPVFAQPYDQDERDPYYDQGQPPPQPPQPYGQRGYQPDDGYQGGDYEQQEGGAYQPPPPPPSGEPGFQVYQGGPQPGYQGGYDSGYSGYGQYAAPQYGYEGGYEGGYGPPPAYGYGGSAGYAGATGYAGQAGAAWRNDQGQYCVWREVTWRDQSGRTAYRWVPRCRD